jgi:hypothetical protein
MGNAVALPILVFSTTTAILLALRADEIGHRLYILRIAGEFQASKIPAALNRRKHRVVVIGHV